MPKLYDLTHKSQIKSITIGAENDTGLDFDIDVVTNFCTYVINISKPIDILNNLTYFEFKRLILENLAHELSV